MKENDQNGRFFPPAAARWIKSCGMRRVAVNERCPNVRQLAFIGFRTAGGQDEMKTRMGRTLFPKGIGILLVSYDP